MPSQSGPTRSHAGQASGTGVGGEHAETQACGSRIFLSSLGGLCFLKLAHLNILKYSEHVNILKKITVPRDV